MHSDKNTVIKNYPYQQNVSFIWITIRTQQSNSTFLKKLTIKYRLVGKMFKISSTNNVPHHRPHLKNFVLLSHNGNQPTAYRAWRHAHVHTTPSILTLVPLWYEPEESWDHIPFCTSNSTKLRSPTVKFRSSGYLPSISNKVIPIQ